MILVSFKSFPRWLAATAAISAFALPTTEAFHPVSLQSTTGVSHSLGVTPAPSVMVAGGARQHAHNRPLTVMYRIRCENKYYQLEELEDADNCTTELFLKEDGTMDIMETDGPIFKKAVGHWEIKENQFAMTITKTFVTGTDNKSDPTGMGEFSFDVERVFEGEMTVVGGTEVAINGKILAEDVVTSKMEKEVGFFNMIDGTDQRLERRPDARPKNIGVIPSPIDSNDVKGHDGIPKEWLEPQAPQVPQMDAFGGGSFGQDAQGYGGGGAGYGQQQQQQASDWGSGSAGYEQQQQQSPGISEYGNPGTFGQESQGYGGGGGYGQGDNGTNDPGPSFADYYGQQQQQEQQQEGYYGDGSQQQQTEYEQTNGDGNTGGSWDDYYNSQGGAGVSPMGGGGGPNPWP
ncbi:unnamed protein product [Pseudo-nitzschia multistriata]|uniref:Uncharacterized protein n=1 Tax=Pseudo-nitzschia multistriata TaxID=183589 RepID=A0A448ZL13_9STRA|nr:unnamed protein product [Pseudo-nitzschia multistriata]